MWYRVMKARLLFVMAALGCGQPTVVEKTGGDTGGANLLALNNFYVKAAAQLKHPPRNLAELKSGSKSQGDLEAVLKSPVDGEPYVIIWGVDHAAPKGVQGGLSVVLAHERKGAGGMRWVLTTTGVNKLTEEQFRAANFPVGYQPAKSDKS